MPDSQTTQLFSPVCCHPPDHVAPYTPSLPSSEEGVGLWERTRGGVRLGYCCRFLLLFFLFLFFSFFVFHFLFLIFKKNFFFFFFQVCSLRDRLIHI